MVAPALTDAQVARARRMMRAGWTLRDVAQTLGVPVGTAERAVYGRAAHYRRTIDGEPPRKADGKKLSDEDRRDIRAAYATGAITQTKLARRYGVSQPAISYIIFTDPDREGD